jgi:hypothetical protein
MRAVPLCFKDSQGFVLADARAYEIVKRLQVEEFKLVLMDTGYKRNGCREEAPRVFARGTQRKRIDDPVQASATSCGKAASCIAAIAGSLRTPRALQRAFGRALAAP